MTDFLILHPTVRVQRQDFSSLLLIILSSLNNMTLDIHEPGLHPINKSQSTTAIPFINPETKLGYQNWSLIPIASQKLAIWHYFYKCSSLKRGSHQWTRQNSFRPLAQNGNRSLNTALIWLILNRKRMISKPHKIRKNYQQATQIITWMKRQKEKSQM